MVSGNGSRGEKSGRTGVMVGLFLVSTLLTNIAAVTSTAFHDFLYHNFHRALLIAAGERATERLFRNSPRVRASDDVRLKTAGLTSEVNDLKGDRTRLTAEKATLKTEVDTLKNEVEVVKGQESDARAALVKAETQNRQLEEKAMRSENEVSSLQEDKKRLLAEAKQREVKAKQVASTVRTRLAKNVKRNVGAIAGESIPYIGIGVTLAVTTMDVYDACHTVDDINQLLVMLGLPPEPNGFCETASRIPKNPVEALARVKSAGMKSLQDAVNEAKGYGQSIPIPSARLPTLGDISSYICPVYRIIGFC